MGQLVCRYSAAIYGGLSALTVEIRDLVVSGNLQVGLDDKHFSKP
jgi:hypothetical protein